MSFFIAIILGLVQGITEFLPISSSGHLLLIEKLSGADVDFVFLNVLLHFATLLAVCVFYRKKLWFMIKNPFCKLNKMLFIATLPAVLFVLLFGILFGDFLSCEQFVGVGFIVSAVFLMVSQYFIKRTKNPQPIGYKGALTMGLAQALAVFPGISRSGTTFAFGTMVGVSRTSALDFSFLMSIPIIIASLVYEMVFSGQSIFNVTASPISIVVSFLCAFLTALLGIKLMQKLVRKISLWWFALYLVIMGIVILVWI